MDAFWLACTVMSTSNVEVGMLPVMSKYSLVAFWLVKLTIAPFHFPVGQPCSKRTPVRQS
jgi:hypothetical protein